MASAPAKNMDIGVALSAHILSSWVRSPLSNRFGDLEKISVFYSKVSIIRLGRSRLLEFEKKKIILVV